MQPKLSARLQDVARFVLNNPEDVAMLTIVEIARSAGVTPSAITRFTHETGLGKFSDLQSVFRQRLVGKRLPYAERLDLLSAGANRGELDLDDPKKVLRVFASAAVDSLIALVEEQPEEGLTQFTAALRDAHAIHVVGGRGASGVAAYAFYGLSAVGKRSFLIDNFGSMRRQQLQSVSPGEVVLAISFDDYTPETVEVAADAKSLGLQVLAITDNELSPLCTHASMCLFVKEGRLGHFRSQVPAMVLLQSVIASVRRGGEGTIGRK